MLRSIIGFVIAWLGAVLGAYALASVLATQIILEKLQDMGVPVTLRDRLAATSHDLVCLAPTYLPLLLVSFLLAMPVAAWLANRFPLASAELFALGGFVAVIALHLILKQALGLNGIAAVRELNGLFLQGFAGALGGYLFFVFSGRAHRSAAGATES